MEGWSEVVGACGVVVGGVGGHEVGGVDEDVMPFC